MSTPRYQGFSGAGVLVLDTSKQQLLLIKDYHGQYNDMGGQLQAPLIDGVLERTAAAELLEETRGVMKVSAAELASAPRVSLPKGYRMYILRRPDTTGLCSRYYAIDPKKAGLGPSFCETEGLTRFPLQQFLGKGGAGPTALTDTGRAVQLHDRVRTGINEALRQGLLTPKPPESPKQPDSSPQKVLTSGSKGAKLQVKTNLTSKPVEKMDRPPTVNTGALSFALASAIAFMTVSLSIV
jgi:hypothetical protein